MKLLKKEDYHKLLDPLKSVEINVFFAIAIAKKHVSGEVFVDNAISPKSFFIIHPYGMTLLLGDSNNKKFNSELHDYLLHKIQPRQNIIWIQAYPASWHEVLTDMFKTELTKTKEASRKSDSLGIELQTRVNFKFNLSKYQEIRCNKVRQNLKIIPTTKQIFEQMTGSVVPSNFWDSAGTFLNKGIGFSLFHENKLVTTAFSAFIIDNYLELGMETFEEFRGKGLATQACFALIDYCLENNYEPIWSCSIENKASYYLALSLGFDVTIEIPYYRLCK